MLSRGELDATEEWMTEDYPHTCTILRAGEGEPDPYRRQVAGEHSPFREDVPCKYWWMSGGERYDRRPVADYQYRLLLPRDTDIREDDIIDHVYEQERKLNQTAHSIQAIGQRSTNLVLVLQEVR